MLLKMRVYLNESVLIHSLEVRILVEESPADGIPSDNCGEILGNYIIHKTDGEPEKYRII